MRTFPVYNAKTGVTVEVPLDSVPAGDFPPRAGVVQGVEVELPLRVAGTMAPTDGQALTGLFAVHPWCVPEIAGDTCEIKTEPHASVGPLIAEYRARVSWLVGQAEARALRVVPIAAEPLIEVRALSAAMSTPGALDRYGVAVLRRAHADCVQINVRVDDGEALLAVYRAICRLAPVLAGIFAASPFARGRLAGVRAYRHVVRRALVNGGDPEHIPEDVGWQRYLESHAALMQIGPTLPSLFAHNGMVRLRPDRMCVENGVCDAVADAERLAALLALHRRVVYGILDARARGEALPRCFGPVDPALRDLAFRTALASAVRHGSAGLGYAADARPLAVRDAFAELLEWAGRSEIPDDPTHPWERAAPLLRDLVDHGSPAERMEREFHALHPRCDRPDGDCRDCEAAVREVCGRLGARFHAGHGHAAESDCGAV